MEIQGHRGSRGTRPENTIPSFIEAIEAGVRGVELDLLITKDREIVIYHDFHLNPKLCLDEKGNRVSPSLVFSMSLKELKKIDCGSLPHPDFPQQKPFPKAKIPTLQELFDFLHTSKLHHARGIRLNLECKRDPKNPSLTPPVEEFVQLVIDLVEKNKYEKQVAISSFDSELLCQIRKKKKNIPVGCIEEKSIDNLLLSADKIQPEVLSPHYSLLVDQKSVEKLQKLPAKIIPWTVNETAVFDRLQKWEVDGIITDYPLLMKQHLDQIYR